MDEDRPLSDVVLDIKNDYVEIKQKWETLQSGGEDDWELDNKREKLDEWIKKTIAKLEREVGG